MGRGDMREEMELVIGRTFIPIELKHAALGLAAGNEPRPGTVLINETQRHINKLMGVSDETYLKHVCKAETPEGGPSSSIQAKVNELCGVDEATFKKYNK